MNEKDRQTIERLRHARENHDEQEAQQLLASLPKIEKRQVTAVVIPKLPKRLKTDST